MHVLVVGNPFGGLVLNGPFDSADAALAYAGNNIEGEWRAINVVPTTSAPLKPEAMADVDMFNELKSIRDAINLIHYGPGSGLNEVLSRLDAVNDALEDRLSYAQM